MVRTELREASDLLRRAAEQVQDADTEERVYDQSMALAELATADRGPDQGRLARHRETLRDIAAELDEEPAALVSEAGELIQSYREGVSGV